MEQYTFFGEAQPVGDNLQGFDAFWKAYPKKRNRGTAENAWIKIRPNAKLQARILEAIETQKQWPAWKKQGGQYIPYPGTWLNAKGWLDEIETPTAGMATGVFGANE